MDTEGASGCMSGTGRGQSNPLAYVLVITMVIMGVTAVITLGGSALDGTRGEAELERAEHSMTLFDSRAAMVALGSSDGQDVNFGLDSGTVVVDEDPGWIAITHVNYTDDADREVEAIYNQSLGVVRYENGDTSIAYQGGGVWRLDSGGDARMVSPPEFHYRGSTLTLPIIQVHGGGSASGSVGVSATPRTQARDVFPNQSAGTVDGPGAPYDEDSFRASYLNPVENGSVYAWIHSDYYEAWADYFDQRTAGNLTVFDHNNTVRLELVSLGGEPGQIEPVPGPGSGSVEAEGFGSQHPIQNFSFTLDKDTSSISNTYWSLWTDDGSDVWEYNVHFDSGSKCNSGTWEGAIEVTQFYRNASTNRNEEWKGTILDPDADDDTAPETAVEVDCDASPTEVRLDLTNTNTDLTYGDFDATGASGAHWHFSSEINTYDSPDSVTFDQHPGVAREPNTFEDPDEIASPTEDTTETVNFTVNHYLSRFDSDFDIRVSSGSGGSPAIDEPNSAGQLSYVETVGSQYITYLHVTENEINVTFD